VFVASSIVILAGRTQRAEALRGRCAALGRSVVTTDDVYDAAVELLRGEPAALVVDLSAFRPAYAGLIALARRRQVTVLGAGPSVSRMPQSLGLEAVQMDDLPDRLAQALTAPADTRAAASGQAPTEAPGQVRQPQAEVHRVVLPSESRPAAASGAAQAQPVSTPPPAHGQQAMPAAPTPQAPSADVADPSQLLTPEEISALLRPKP
jgi:hypothetical protein